MRQTLLPLAVALLVSACSTTARPEASSTPPPAPTALPAAPVGAAQAVDDGPTTVTTTALGGNRVTAGRLRLDAAVVRLDAGFVPTVLLAAPVSAGHLLVATDRAAVAAWVVTDGVVTQAPAGALTALGRPPEAGRPALVVRDGTWRFAEGAAGGGDTGWLVDGARLSTRGDTVTFGALTIPDVLPDARFALDDDLLVVPTGPTSEYGHGVLGDVMEASGLAVLERATGALRHVPLPTGSVLEGTGVVLADVDDDGRNEPVFTVSAPGAGARQAVLLDDDLLLGPAIGRSNRWRHLLGVADGHLYEIVTPHLDRVFQTLRLEGGTLAVTTSTPDAIASHDIGSRDLDRAALVDVTGDGTADVLGPAARADGVLRVVDGRSGATVRDIDLGAGQRSNIVVMAQEAVAVAAAGLADGTVLLLGTDG